MRPMARAFPWLLLAAALAAFLCAPGADTVPLFAAREKLQCQTCHVDPNGGGVRNEFGFNYARNRHSLTPETGTPWGDLTLVNRVGENMPLYVGLNLRQMLLATTSIADDSLDRAGFFSMESQLHFSFQPHPNLATNVTWDYGPFSGSVVREAYGMLRGGPWGGYLKMGRIRVPYGLRMDDHTVATRNGYLDFSTLERFLPYDPRGVDAGIEAGASEGGFFGRAALTNGTADPIVGSNKYAQAKTLKLGYQAGPYQGAVSLYDDFNSDPSAFPFRRATRWGYYGMLRVGPVTGLGEVGAGTDRLAGDVNHNLLAAFGEVDWQPEHPLNFRLRYDYLQTDRSLDDTRHDRWAVEGEWLPVPFAELRLVFRDINHKDKLIPDEHQVYLQGHFSY